MLALVAGRSDNKPVYAITLTDPENVKESGECRIKQIRGKWVVSGRNVRQFNEHFTRLDAVNWYFKTIGFATPQRIVEQLKKKQIVEI